MKKNSKFDESFKIVKRAAGVLLSAIMISANNFGVLASSADHIVDGYYVGPLTDADLESILNAMELSPTEKWWMAGDSKSNISLPASDAVAVKAETAAGKTETAAVKTETAAVKTETAAVKTEAERQETLVWVNFRTGPSKEHSSMRVLSPKTQVMVDARLESGWSKVAVDGVSGYIKSEYLGSPGQSEAPAASAGVELLDWWDGAKPLFKKGVDTKVYDVYTGLSYNVRSFSNGNHADVEPSTEADTAILKKTYGGSWSWTPRPVIVDLGGRMIAASINGMPHGGGVISGNGMNGQVCIHFLNSKTHNGNRSFERDHQAALKKAYELSK